MPPRPQPAILCKIFRAAEWQAFRAEGRFAGSPDDLSDGFIHLSTPDQLEGTLARHFSDQLGSGGSGLIVADLDLAGDPALHFEPARGGTLFPHLYRALRADDLVGWRAVD